MIVAERPEQNALNIYRRVGQLLAVKIKKRPYKPGKRIITTKEHLCLVQQKGMNREGKRKNVKWRGGTSEPGQQVEVPEVPEDLSLILWRDVTMMEENRLLQVVL